MKLESPFKKKQKTSVQHGKVTPLKDLAIFKNSKTLYIGNQK